MNDAAAPAPGELLVLSGPQCRDLIDLGELRDAIARSLRAHSDGRADVPPRVGARAERGLLGAMPGHVAGVGLAAKLVSVFPGNHGGAIPSHQGLIALFDADNGRPLALMDGAHITAVRTAATAALTADLAADRDARTLAVLGAGVQGQNQARTFATIRPWTEIRIASRTRAHAENLAASVSDATVAPSFEDAVRGADVVALCTDSAEPVIDRAWVGEGAHVSSVGMGHEVDPATIAAADRILVEWRGAVSNPPPAGARELQGIDAADVVEVGEVIAGRATARSDSSELTVFKSTGHAVEDVASARLVYDRALATGTGTLVPI